MDKSKQLESILWSIALPGFGQLLNGKYLKGFLLIGLEFWINTHSRLNEVIISSFNGNLKQAINQTDYHWLMFYPCLYMFAIWDANKDAGGGKPHEAVPYAFGAYFGTIGIIYSRNLLGAVWLGLIGMIIGIGIGLMIKRILLKRTMKS